MRCLNGRKIRRAAAKTGIAVLVSVMLISFCFALSPVIPLNADSQIVLSAIAKQSNLGPGDLLTVSVVANRMPGIIEFGPIVLNYDKDEADYVSFEQGSELTNYVFTETQTAGSIVVSGTDQMVTVGSDGSGDEVSSASFSSENQVVLF